MKLDQKEYERLARYLSGDITETDAREIEARRTSDPVYFELVEKFRKVWEARMVRENPFETEPAWEKLCKHIDIAESRVAHEVSEGKPIRIRRRPDQRGSGASWLLRVAAVFLAAGLMGLFMVLSPVFTGEQATEQEMVMREVVTERGQRSNIHLKDGSRIVLNSVGSISYVSDFDEETREVYLQGEAFFDIAKDDRPFIVYADEAVIKILGTEFAVRSYKGEDIKVAVSTGLVSVRHRDGSEIETVELGMGDVAQLSRDAEKSLVVRRNADLTRYIGWLTYQYSYIDTPLGVIAAELERTYGVDIEFVDPSLASLRIAANFEGDSIHEVLQVIHLLLEIEYEMTGRNILFSKRDPETKNQEI